MKLRGVSLVLVTATFMVAVTRCGKPTTERPAQVGWEHPTSHRRVQVFLGDKGDISYVGWTKISDAGLVREQRDALSLGEFWFILDKARNLERSARGAEDETLKGGASHTPLVGQLRCHDRAPWLHVQWLIETFEHAQYARLELLVGATTGSARADRQGGTWLGLWLLSVADNNLDLGGSKEMKLELNTEQMDGKLHLTCSLDGEILDVTALRDALNEQARSGTLDVDMSIGEAVEWKAVAQVFAGASQAGLKTVKIRRLGFANQTVEGSRFLPIGDALGTAGRATPRPEPIVLGFGG